MSPPPFGQQYVRSLFIYENTIYRVRLEIGDEPILGFTG